MQVYFLHPTFETLKCIKVGLLIFKQNLVIVMFIYCLNIN